MFSCIAHQAPRSRLQYTIRAWALLTSGLYLAVAAAAAVIGSPDWGATAIVILAGMLSGPLLLALGSLKWASGRAVAARRLGLLLMVFGLVPLVSFSGLLAPFVLIALPAGWRWRGS